MSTITKTEIERKIEELKEQLKNVRGRRTEIYTRIVGYYRSLDNWNKGKKEEYKHRKTFLPTSIEKDFSIKTEEILYFYRQDCPYCPAVKNILAEENMEYKSVDVDTVEGLALAEKYGIFGTPTVLFLDADKKERARATSPDTLRNIIEEKLTTC
ncbi:anaerobic ribonucleoside-triphosphate reductase [Spirochaetia bacterium 38H-sp]|uniref:Anaerobic ribonucleoside-triphosphate reductase n=1 Tax=Rarispira pelagica TaxID=3141764 RepID=A0ABU9UDF1_9SPIR